MTCYITTLLVFLEALHVCVFEILQLKHTKGICGFKVLPKVNMKISVVWNVTPCCLIEVKMREQMVEEPNRKPLR